jgi:hypothetical protein
MNYTQLYQAIQDYSENTEALFVANIPLFVQEAETRIYNAVNLPSLRKSVSGSLTANNPYLSCPNNFLSSYSLGVVDASGNYNYMLNKDVNFIREAYPNPTTSVGMPKFYSLFGTQTSNPNALSLLLAPTPDANYTMELNYFYYPVSIVQGALNSVGNITGGSLYTNGTYNNVPLTGGSGSGAIANIVVSGQTVTTVTVINGGSFYAVGNQLTCSNAYIGGSGSGFIYTATQTNNANGTSWLGDNYDPALFYGTMREAMLFMKGEADLIKYYEEKYQEAMMELRRLADGLERGDFYRDGQLKIDVSGKGRS